MKGKASKASLIHKGILLVLSLITMGLGLFAHYASSWVEIKGIEGVDVQPYRICEDDVYNLLPINLTDEIKCPKIVMERFFVAMIIICAIWSLARVALEFAAGGNTYVKYADKGLNVILGLLLIAGSVLFIVSAQQISKLYFGLGLDGLFNALDVEFRQRREAKIVAGALGVIQAMLHIGAAGLK